VYIGLYNVLEYAGQGNVGWWTTKANTMRFRASLFELCPLTPKKICNCFLSGIVNYVFTVFRRLLDYLGGSVAEWLACWTQAQKGRGLNRSRDAVG